MNVDEAIRTFWSWWENSQHRIRHAIEVDRKFNEELLAEISTHVDSIGDLDWELSPGKTARHAFCLSARHDPTARVVTEVWRRRGPIPNDTWEYFSSRQGGPNTAIVFHGVRFVRDDLVVSFEVDAARERIDGLYSHPGFSQLPPGLRSPALYLLLDGAFGEDLVERWFGKIEVSEESPPDYVPFAQLEVALVQLQECATGEQFAVVQLETEAGSPLFVTYNQALKRIDHLLHTAHVSVDLAILDQNPDGLTTAADASELNALEDELTTALGPLGVYFGRETRPGHRVLHWYAPEDSAAQQILERWATQHPRRQPKIEWTRDVNWEFADRYAQ